MEEAEKRHLKTAVRALVEHMLRSGDLVLEFAVGSRQVEGILAHQKLQKARPAEYKKEVSVAFQVENDDFILDIGGRIDGVFEYPDRAIVEEIKSTYRELEAVEQAENQRHWGQLKVYAYIYAMQNDLEEIAGRLTYYQVDTGDTLELDRSFTLAELETFFNNLVARYLGWAKKMDEWYQVRAAGCESLAFPYPAYRPGQREMAAAVYRTIENSDQLIAQAPTGIGKTMAVLFPTLKSLGRGLVGKFFYLTARTTGKAAAEKALQEMREKGAKIKSLTLTAKEKICFSPGSACTGEECEFARGYYDRVDEALEEFFDCDSFGRDTVEELARKYRVCPFEFSLELSLWVDAVICDYNYAFDPAVYLRRFFGEEESGEQYLFLIDEAHNLVDRAREMFSAELQKRFFQDLRRKVKDYAPGIYRSAGKVDKWLNECRKRCTEAGSPSAEREPPEDLYPLLHGFLRAAQQWLVQKQNLKSLLREPVLEVYFQVSAFLRTADQYDESYATCSEAIGRDFKLKLFCIDPARQLEAAMNRCTAAVLFSATMTPTDYFRQILGCRQEAQSLVLPSPFPQENLCLLVDDKISTLYRRRENTREQVSRALSSLVRQKRGNYLVFFPSYQYMQMVHESFMAAGGNAEMDILVQTPGMSEPERDAFLEQFSAENAKTLVGFVVMGGIFGEGIDLVGDRLTGAVVVGVGLPGISLERDLIRDYFAEPERGGTGFQFAYLYPGFNRVLQAAGRVIRSENDRGVVLLIDERFSRYQYTSLFPGEWQPVRIGAENDLARVLEEFWGS